MDTSGQTDLEVGQEASEAPARPPVTSTVGPLPVTARKPKKGHSLRRTGSLDSGAARELFAARLCKSEADFQRITGETGDVEKDPTVAYGDMALTYDKVSFSVGEKVILEPTSGHIEPGSLVAVMGPSGCGKSTLLDVLAGKKSKPHGGTVHFNGRPRDHLFQRMSAYVSQDDILPAYLTVQEVVMFHQQLKQERPSKLTMDMLTQRIEKSLDDLGLVGVANSLIGDQAVRGISGGQRRRVSLACGFAAFPHIMFCDEPTSGLSATDAEACVKYMRLIAHKYNITIVVVIHQPRLEVAKLFDSLILLTSGPGRCVYNGPMQDVANHCAAVGYPVPSHANPTDFIMDRITPGTLKSREDEFLDFYQMDSQPAIDAMVATHLNADRCDALELLQRQWSKMREYGSMPPIRETKYAVRFRTQLYVVGCRQLTLYFRDSRGVIADLLISIGKGLILGLTYLHIGERGASAQLAFFFMLMMATSIDGMKGMPKLIGERRVMKMETSEALYSEWAYIMPFTVISWIQAVCANTIFIVIVFSLSTLQWPMFGAIWLWTTMLYLTMDSMFLMLSAAAKDASTAMVMALPFFMLFLLFNGFTVGRQSAPWYLVWIVDISPVAYAIEQATIAGSKFYKSDDYAAIVGFFAYRDEPGTALAVMFGVMAFFRFLQVLSLKFLNNIQR